MLAISHSDAYFKFDNDTLKSSYLFRAYYTYKITKLLTVLAFTCGLTASLLVIAIKFHCNHYTDSKAGRVIFEFIILVWSQTTIILNNIGAKRADDSPFIASD